MRPVALPDDVALFVVHNDRGKLVRIKPDAHAQIALAVGQSHVRRTGVLQTHNQPRFSIGIAERNAGVAIVGHFEFRANLAALIRQNQSRCFRLAVHRKGAAQVAALVSQNETLRFDGACHVGLALTHKEGGQNQDGEADSRRGDNENSAARDLPAAGVFLRFVSQPFLILVD